MLKLLLMLDWITLQAVVEIWEKFKTRFLDLWDSEGHGDLYPDSLFGPSAPAGASSLKVRILPRCSGPWHERETGKIAAERRPLRPNIEDQAPLAPGAMHAPHWLKATKSSSCSHVSFTRKGNQGSLACLTGLVIQLKFVALTCSSHLGFALPSFSTALTTADWHGLVVSRSLFWSHHRMWMHA